MLLTELRTTQPHRDTILVVTCLHSLNFQTTKKNSHFNRRSLVLQPALWNGVRIRHRAYSS